MQFNFTPTGIGSLPHKDAAQATQLIVKHLTAIPFWPQLPQRSFLEGMATQFAEGLPDVVIDEPNKKIWVETNNIETGLADFYQHYLDNDIDYFAISLERAVGFYGMLHRLQKDSGKLQYVKGQVTGPITFGAMLTDKEGVALMHHPALAEALNKCLIMKARWQIDAFKKLNLKSIIFLDEPYLMGYGSAYVPLTKETVISRLTEVIEEVHKDGALVGIHCCGNTDWSVLLATPVDILNFDGYGFMDKLMLYTDDLKRFIERGGVIAWGVVPSIELDKPVTAEEIITKLDQGVNTLAKKGIDPAQIAAQSILTPSCGLGALVPDEAEKRLQLLTEVASEYARNHLR